jgi:hypothetical protein
MIYFTKLSDEQIMQDGVKSLETGCLSANCPLRHLVQHPVLI